MQKCILDSNLKNSRNRNLTYVERIEDGFQDVFILLLGKEWQSKHLPNFFLFVFWFSENGLQGIDEG